MAPASVARQQTEEAFLDAAERLLVDVGHAGVTTRGLAEEAGANHGLVHYYFGSMESLLARACSSGSQTADRPPAGDVLGAGRAVHREVADSDQYLDADREYQKVWYELARWTGPICASASPTSTPSGARC